MKCDEYAIEHFDPSGGTFNSMCFSTTPNMDVKRFGYSCSVPVGKCFYNNGATSFPRAPFVNGAPPFNDTLYNVFTLSFVGPSKDPIRSTTYTAFTLSTPNDVRYATVNQILIPMPMASFQLLASGQPIATSAVSTLQVGNPTWGISSGLDNAFNWYFDGTFMQMKYGFVNTSFPTFPRAYGMYLYFTNTPTGATHTIEIPNKVLNAMSTYVQNGIKYLEYSIYGDSEHYCSMQRLVLPN